MLNSIVFDVRLHKAGRVCHFVNVATRECGVQSMQLAAPLVLFGFGPVPMNTTDNIAIQHLTMAAGFR